MRNWGEPFVFGIITLIAAICTAAIVVFVYH